MQIQEVTLRWALIQRSLMMFFDHPLLGVGLAQFVPKTYSEYRGKVPVPESSEEQTQHNHLMGMMVELGMMGTIIYATILLLFFSRLRELLMLAKATAGKVVDWNIIVVISLVGMSFILLGFFMEPSYSLFANSILFSFIGLSDGIYNNIIYCRPT